MTTDQPLRAAHPRLARLMAWQGTLSDSEVESALRDLRAGRTQGGCEAVAHYGGPRRLFIDALRARTSPYVASKVLGR